MRKILLIGLLGLLLGGCRGRKLNELNSVESRPAERKAGEA